MPLAARTAARTSGAYGGAYSSSGSSEDDPAGLEAGPDEPERLERMQDGVEVSMQDTDEIGAVEQEGEQPDPIIERAEEPPPPPARRPRGRPRKNKRVARPTTGRAAQFLVGTSRGARDCVREMARM